MTAKIQKITDISPTIQYVGNGVLKSYDVPFMVFEGKDELQIYLGETLLVEGYEFTESDVSQGGTVVFAQAPANGVLITISRVCAFEALASWPDGGDLRPEVLNREFNHAIALSQQNKATLKRSFVLPEYVTGVSVELPSPDPGHTFIWSEDGKKLVNSSGKFDTIVSEATAQAKAAASSATAAANSAAAAAATAAAFDVNAANKTAAFNENAALKQSAVDASAAEAASSASASAGSAETARKWAVGTIEEQPAGSAKYWAEKTQDIFNAADVQSQSIYQERVVMDSAAIVLQERKCRYFRNVASGDAFTINVSNVKQTGKDITVDLIINMPAVVPFSLAAIVPDASKWLGGEAPDFSEAGEHWVAFVSSDGGVTWRGSYEGKFTI